MKRTVLVTGGSSGIGTSIVDLFAKNGFKVLFTYNSRKQSAQKIVDQLETYDVQMFHFSQGNLESQEKLLAKLPDRIDVLINNAAVGSATVKRLSDNKYEQDRNQSGWIRCDLPCCHRSGRASRRPYNRPGF